jgi:hypothetical protein
MGLPSTEVYEQTDTQIDAGFYSPCTGGFAHARLAGRISADRCR